MQSSLFSPGALSGVRVLDLTRVLAGPWCTQNLADLGAEVIKVERPGSGDDTRAWGPPYLGDSGAAAYFLTANRGKKSMTLDIASPEGQETIRQLVQKCDVLVENFKAGQLAKYGLDYESLKKLKPDLIFCSITGFGQTGPWSHRPGYDLIVQGMSGFMSVTGERDDLPGGGPQKAGVPVADLFTGMYATVAIVSALFHRQRTGIGQAIDIALLDVMVAAMANMNSNYLTSGIAPKRLGNVHPNVAPYQTFACSDGFIIVAVGNDTQFRKFCTATGCGSLADDARFASNSDRLRNRDELVERLEQAMRQRKRSEWIAALEEAGVPCGPINTLDEVFENPQIKARGMRVDLPHPSGLIAPLVANPIKMSVTPPRYILPPPQLGQHTEEILKAYVHQSANDEHG